MQKYANFIETQNETDKKVIDCCLNNYTDFFEITKIDPENYTLKLTSITDKQKPAVEITDVGLSNSATIGSIIFTRIIDFDTINMTSGISMVFPSVVKSNLLKYYNQEIFKYIGKNEFNAKKWQIAFELNESMGLDVIHTLPFNAQNS
jgi:hypothetical protein